MSSVITSEPTESLFLNSFCFALRFDDPELLLPDFSKYLFRGEAIRKQIRSTSSGVTRINISKSRFLKVRIPVPPLEVQREIVRILDQFTQLEAELEARRAQYAHYRDLLLTFPDESVARWTTLGEISSRVSSGATPVAGRSEYYDHGAIPWLRTQEVRFVDIWDTNVQCQRSLKSRPVSLFEM